MRINIRTKKKGRAGENCLEVYVYTLYYCVGARTMYVLNMLVRLEMELIRKI